MQATSTPQAFSHRIGRLTKAVLFLLVVGTLVGAVLVLSTGRPDPLAMAPSALQAEGLRLLSPYFRESNDLVYRPLFWEGRRPLDEPAVAAVRPAEQAGSLDQISLQGVFASDTQSGVIVTVRGERRRVFLGDTVEGWTLSSLTPQRAVFARAGNGNASIEEALVLEHVMSAGAATVNRAVDLNDAAQERSNTNQAGAQESERETNE